MKRLLMPLCFCVIAMTAQTKAVAEEIIDSDASYAMGMVFAMNFTNDGLFPSTDEFAQGMREIFDGDETRYTLEESSQLAQEELDALMAEREAEDEPDRATISPDASYAIGMIIGNNFSHDNLNLSPKMDEFTLGMKSVLDGSATRMTMDEANAIVDKTFAALAEQETAAAKQAEAEFLAENATKPGILTTDSGLQYEIITEGTGEKPTADDAVYVHYEGTFTDGTVFDSSGEENDPVLIALADVIPGWTEGLQLMNVGSTFRFYIPSHLGYGPQGIQPIIPPHATLIFEVELVGIDSE